MIRLTEQEHHAVAVHLLSADRATTRAALRLGDGPTRRHAVRSPLLLALLAALALAVVVLTCALGDVLAAAPGDVKRDRAQASNPAQVVPLATNAGTAESVR